jgi:hypothetical protein
LECDSVKLVSFLGDLQRSAKLEVPIYRLIGGPGFLWSANSDREGRGTLRFLAIDASQVVPANASSTEHLPSVAEHSIPAESSASTSDNIRNTDSQARQKVPSAAAVETDQA